MLTLAHVIVAFFCKKKVIDLPDCIETAAAATAPLSTEYFADSIEEIQWLGTDKTRLWTSLARHDQL